MINFGANKYELGSTAPIFISATKEQFLERCQVQTARLFASGMLVSVFFFIVR